MSHNNDKKENKTIICKKIAEFREMFKKEPKNIPNEPRYIKKGVLDSNIFYPLDNIYPNKKTDSLNPLPFLFVPETQISTDEWFLERLHQNEILYAIKYLQFNALKNVLEEKGNYETKIFEPFHQFLFCEYPILENAEIIKKMFELLIQFYPNYKNYLEILESYPTNNDKLNTNKKQILNIFYEYLEKLNKDTIDEKDICSFCLMSEPKDKLLYKLCVCKNPIHLSCFLDMMNHKQFDDRTCMICKRDYRICSKQAPFKMNSLLGGVSKYETIFFPYHDLYPIPLSSCKELFKSFGMKRLEMAIMYLQFERVEGLLKEPEILEKLSDFYIGYEGYKMTPLHYLSSGNVGDNFMFNLGANKLLYLQIMKLLLKTKKIDLDKKDVFDKMVDDYLNKDIMIKTIFQMALK